MNLIAVKDLKAPKVLRERLRREGELLLTSDGKPMAVLVNVAPTDDPELVMGAIRQARSRLALSRIRDAARHSGAAHLSAGRIEQEIVAVRKVHTRRQ